jgi:hypothetical protein
VAKGRDHVLHVLLRLQLMERRRLGLREAAGSDGVTGGRASAPGAESVDFLRLRAVAAELAPRERPRLSPADGVRSP